VGGAGSAKLSYQFGCSCFSFSISCFLWIVRKFYKNTKKRRIVMFRWAIIFAVIALIASFLGFGGVAGLSANLAYVFLAVAVILFIIAFISRKV